MGYGDSLLMKICNSNIGYNGVDESKKEKKLKKKRAFCKRLKIYMYLLLIIIVLLCIPFIWGPSIRTEIKQARDAELLLTDEDLASFYEPIPNAKENSGTELCDVVSIFRNWEMFFKYHKDDYDFQYEEGYEPSFSHDMNFYGEYYPPYPEPKSLFAAITSADMANLRYYVECHEEEYLRLHEAIKSTDKIYFPDWLDFSGHYEKGIDELNSSVKLLKKEIDYYLYDGKYEQAYAVIDDLIKMSGICKQVYTRNGKQLCIYIDWDLSSLVIESICIGASLSKIENIGSSLEYQDLDRYFLKLLSVNKSYIDNVRIDYYGCFEPLGNILWDVKLVRQANKRNLLKALCEFRNRYEVIDDSNILSLVDEFGEIAYPKKNSFSMLFNSLTREHFSLTWRGLLLLYRSEMTRRAALITISLEQYKERNGRYASSLSELKAFSTDLVIGDIYAGGKDLNYRILNENCDGYLLWSDLESKLGDDEVDPLIECMETPEPYLKIMNRFVLKVVKP